MRSALGRANPKTRLAKTPPGRLPRRCRRASAAASAAGARCFFSPRVPSLLPTDRRSSRKKPATNNPTTTTTAWCFLNNLSRDFPPVADAEAAPGWTGGRAPLRLTGRAAWPNPGAGVPGVVAFALSGAFWRASEPEPTPSPCRNHLVFTVTLLPCALAQISRISVKQPEHLSGLILNL